RGRRRDTDRPRSTDIGPLLEKLAVSIEDLNAPVLPVADIHVAICIRGDGMRRVKLPGFCAALSPGSDPVSVLIDLCDARIAVAVAYEAVPRGVPGNVRGPVE